MKRKNSLITALILTIVVVVSVFSAVSLMSVSALSPPFISAKQTNNANDCSADENCQTNSLSIGNYDYKIDNVQMGEVVPVELNGIPFEVRLYQVEENREHAIIDVQRRGGNSQQRFSLAPGETFTLDENAGLKFMNLAINQDYDIDFMMSIGFGIKGTEETLTSSNWKGEGNAYACLDKFGSVFRSDSPCL